MQSNKNTNIILVILAVVILIIVFVYARGTGTQDVTSGLVAENTSNSSEISAFLRRISAIKDVRLDISVFDNPVLKNGLKDTSQELVPEEKGRINPFAPINGQSASVSQNFSNITPTEITVPEIIIPTRVLSD